MYARFLVLMVLLMLIITAAGCAPVPAAPVLTPPVPASPSPLPSLTAAAAPTEAPPTQASTETPQTAIPEASTSTSSPVPPAAPPATTAVTPAETMTPAPSTGSTRAGSPAGTATTPGASAAVFVDDRSSAGKVLTSFVNAINRQEYSRAYSYWRGAGPDQGLPPFDKFVQGYKDTKSVELTIGAISTDVGAGQLYYYVPVVLVALTTGNQVQTFAGCYGLHLARPEIQDAPPFEPLAIERASVKQASSGASVEALLGAACRGNGGQPEATPAPVDPEDISAARYIDNRSDPVSLIRSLFNAVNSQQYDRAYSYWASTPGTLGGPPTYAAFKQGYADTKSVALVTGSVTTGAAAGTIYYAVPAVLQVHLTNGGQRTYYGCYTVRQPQPANQAQPPFQPTGIDTGTFHVADGGADTHALLQNACK